MSFKKRFDKRIEEDKKSRITESDRAFLASLESYVVEPPEGEVRVKTFNYKALLYSVACAIVAALTVFIIVYFTVKPGNAPVTPPDYFFDESDPVVSDLSELNGDLILFAFEADTNKYKTVVEKVYDSVSNDTLYYVLTVTNAIPDFELSARIVIVVNENYTFAPGDYNRETVEDTIFGYTIKYTQMLTTIATMDTIKVYEAKCKGEMQIGTQWVYITQYQETTVDENTFLNTLKSFIHIKG